MVDIFLAQVKNIVYLCIVIGLETVAVKSLTDTFVVRTKQHPVSAQSAIEKYHLLIKNRRIYYVKDNRIAAWWQLEEIRSYIL